MKLLILIDSSFAGDLFEGLNIVKLLYPLEALEQAQEILSKLGDDREIQFDLGDNTPIDKEEVLLVYYNELTSPLLCWIIPYLKNVYEFDSNEGFHFINYGAKKLSPIQAEKLVKRLSTQEHTEGEQSPTDDIIDESAAEGEDGE